jgi:putative ABC transport system permease protein
MNLLSVVFIAAKRLWNNKGLTLCAIIGLITAVALISSIPLYTDAANFKVLQEKLSGATEGGGPSRPPFAFMYRYIGAWHGAVDLDQFDPVNEYVQQSVPGIIGLPVVKSTRYVKTDNFSLFPASEAAYIGLRQPLGWVNLGWVDEIQDHITVLEGSFPEAATPDADTVQVMVSEEFATEIGLQSGEEYVIFQRAQGGGDTAEATESKPVQYNIYVSGIWTATDENDSYWFYNPKSLNNTLLLPEESFRLKIAPPVKNEIYAAIWYIVFDGDKVRTDDVPNLLGRIGYANTRVSTLLPNTVLDVSPQEELESYRWTTFVMTIVLYVFAIPILGLVLYFIGMIAGLVVERQRGEIAILKSRGAGDTQVIGIYALEGAMIGLIGLAGGLVLGKQLALIMGNTISFLSFADRGVLPVIVTPRAVRLALLGVGISMLASLWPAMRAARLTIVTYKQDRARSLQRPVWQRFFLDFLLLIPSGYGYYILQNRGTISFLNNQGVSGDPFSDPLLFLVPSLTILAVSLVVIRIFPLVMELLAWATSQVVRSVSVVLALRQLARVSKQYTGSLLLLILTLSLATFTASMARTLDQSLTDRMQYRYGGDYLLSEAGENPEADTGGGAGAAGGSDTSSSDAQVDVLQAGGWVFVPVSEHLKVPGIRAATRIGEYGVQGTFGKTTAKGRFFAIDRMDFPKTAYFRQDYAYSQLGTLMNRLAVDSSAILVTPSFLANNQLDIGDRIELTVSVWGERRAIQFVIADFIKLFPTYYPETDQDQLFVGNLDYIFEQMGGVFPYDVWVRTNPDIDIATMQEQLRDLDIRVIQVRGSREAIAKEQDRPERTGVFGILSVGFVAAAILTLLGFLLHSFISFRRRFIEFGVLRAIGLSIGQMIGFLGIEQVLLIATGISAGTGLGIWVSNLFIPFLQVGTARNIDIPPFVVLIAWDDVIKIYVVFGVMLLVAVASMIWFLMHLKIFEAVKLGEAV